MNISKHLFFGLSLLALTTFACKSSKPAVTDTTTPKRPNIVFIMADDHAVSSISAYEDWLADIAPTPNIDRIANEGMLMTRTFNTNSICGPSRAAILTGKYSHVSGFFKNEKGGDFDGSQMTFPKLFQKS